MQRMLGYGKTRFAKQSHANMVKKQSGNIFRSQLEHRFDESYWNKYLFENPPKKILTGE